MQVWFVCGWQVKLCDPVVTHGPYLSALELKGYMCLLTCMLSVSFHRPSASLNSVNFGSGTWDDDRRLPSLQIAISDTLLRF